ncbi:MAG: NAD(P)H-hydrate dehydratase [Chlamydiae bacterium]|nr:NAD(P)H-hydrate dehydratase [Chlamydiota bacterium]
MKHLLKVVTSEEMARIERLAYSSGISEDYFMEQAGKNVASFIKEFVSKTNRYDRLVIFAGKGNNGGDAFVAGYYLQQAGFHVEIVHPFENSVCTPLCVKQKNRCMNANIPILSYEIIKNSSLGMNDLVVDGLVGTGFKGVPQGALAEGINIMNHSGAFVISLDIPSGLCGSSGRVHGSAVIANLTLFLEIPKIGFFLDNGWDYCGKLEQILFGLSQQHIDQAREEAWLCLKETALALLPAMKRNRHKYQAGYVLALAGSKSMPGAAALSTRSAMHAGAGIVRLFISAELEDMFISVPVEVIKEKTDINRISEEMLRASAFFIGPGLGRDAKALQLCEQVLSRMKVPCVIDADALFFLSCRPDFDIPLHSVLTPHYGEMRSLLGKHSDESFFILCQDYVDRKNVVMLLKGAPTFIFSKHLKPIIIPYGDPGMATAGSGDVLTGIIAALLSQKVPCLEATVLGAYLHAVAGEETAKEKSSYSMVASDIIEFLPHAFKSLLKRNRKIQ